MTSKRLIYTQLTVTIILLSSCIKEVPFNGDETDASLTLDAVVANDSVFEVRLEQSVFFLHQENSRKIKENAVLTLHDQTNDLLYEVSTPEEENRYVFPITVQPSNKYKLTVTHPDFETIESSIKTIKTVPIISCDTSTENNASRIFVDLTWQDPAEEDNFYMVIVRQTQEAINNYDAPFGHLEFTTEDPNLVEAEIFEIIDDGYTYPIRTAVLTDKSFNGTTKTFHFDFNNPFYFYESEDEQNRKIEICLISINEDFLNYWLSVQQFGQLEEFSEPLQIYTNVQNGFGIFGSVGYDMVMFKNY